MDVSERLSNLRSAVPGCHLAAFIDLSSKMVLAVNARSNQPQERLDVLADQAERLLSAPDVIIEDPAPSQPSAHIPDYVVTSSPENLEVFVRSAGDANEALGLVCAINTDIELALDQCDAILIAIGKES